MMRNLVFLKSPLLHVFLYFSRLKNLAIHAQINACGQVFELRNGIAQIKTAIRRRKTVNWNQRTGQNNCLILSFQIFFQIFGGVRHGVCAMRDYDFCVLAFLHSFANQLNVLRRQIAAVFHANLGKIAVVTKF